MRPGVGAASAVGLGRVAVTGAGGRLGRALMAALDRRAPGSAVAWNRPDFDLDALDPVRLLERDRPSLVIHAAAWTDVDGCATNPSVALLRNGEATGRLADACAAAGAGLVVISTDEVFDGRRTDGRGYAEEDPTNPVNAYGASKLAGEEAARRAFGGRAGLWVVRTAWLYGPPGGDFPAKILVAADRLGYGDPLPVVADESGSPTFTLDLAGGILQLVGAAPEGGAFHLVNAGTATRYDWAAEILRRCRPGRSLRPISQAEFQRASTPPAWAVLDASRAAGLGVRLRSWDEALAGYLSSFC